MKTKRTIGFINVLLFVSLMLGISVFALSPIDDVRETENSRDYYTEYTSAYDTVYVAGTHGYGKRVYEPGWLFTWWKARSETTVSLETAPPGTAISVYAYARIENRNNNVSSYRFNDTLYNGKCTAATEYIVSQYATHIEHEAWLKLNGVNDWNINSGIYTLP